MSLELLLGTLTQEAAAESEAVLASARADAESIRSQTAAALAARRATVMASRSAEANARIERALADARRDARREELDARARVLERVFSRAREELPRIAARPEYRALLAGQVREALRCLGHRVATIRCAPGLVDDVRRATDRSVVLRPDPSVGTGFLLRSDDGSLEIDGTLEDRLCRLGPRLAVDVVAALEGS